MPRPKLNSLVPLLTCVDLSETITFYTEKLGFEVVSLGPEEQPFWCSLRRDDVQLMFYRLAEQDPQMSGAMYIYPDNVTAYWELIRGNIKATQALTVTDRGQRQFSVTDPNGYVIHFSEPV